MITKWLDNRTGYRFLLDTALRENIPGGARWRYVFGSTLMFTFAVQVITGLFLWMGYSPGARSAWESVFHLQVQIPFGSLLRGIHHFTAQAMIVLLALHVLQVVLNRAYKAPRELNFWLGIALLQIVLALSLTGYLLPWDQKGYWATNVATNLMALVPFIGTEVQSLAVGGPAYGHATLTRFFALHAGVLPIALTSVLVLHLMLFRRHGVCAVKPDDRRAETFWPRQALMDATACLLVMLVILLLAWRGASLGAPADPAVPYSAARPEWYFLFLFQLLKYFHGEAEIVGALIVPGLAMGLLFLMPFTGRWRWGHRFNVAVLLALGFGILSLTFLALYEDRNDPVHQEAVLAAERNGERAVLLASSPTGIPESGAISLLRNDSMTQGPVLFTRHCASCHAYTPVDDSSGRAIESRTPSAPDLHGFGTRPWLEGLLDAKRIAGPEYFGNTAHKDGDMVEYVQADLPEKETWSKEQIDQVIAALEAEAGHRIDENMDAGKALIKDIDRCAMCHTFHEQKENADGPDLTGYASREWMIDFIGNPARTRFYGGTNDRMPAYVKFPDRPLDNILTSKEISLIVDWLRGEWYEPVQ